jgi:hypothetical protein
MAYHQVDGGCSRSVSGDNAKVADIQSKAS